MARYTGPKAKRWRRLGQVPADGSALAVSRRNYPPGQHGLRRGAKLSEYGQQLQEKQKAKYTYGLLERQFANYYRKADKSSGVTGETLMRLLELRLDNVLFRAGLAASRDQARQLVSHGHVRVGGEKVNAPGYQVKSGDEITLADKYKKTFTEGQEEDALESVSPPSWLNLDPKKLVVKVLSEPARTDIDASINEQLIVALS